MLSLCTLYLDTTMLRYAVLAILLLQYARDYSLQTNALILHLADYVGAANIWIGLVCPDTNAKNCVWDDGRIGADQYNAFYPGYPCGNCDQHWLHMFNSKAGDSAGKWASASIYRAKIGYVCEVSTRGTVT
ncbi:unnamed protein product [Cylicostephanus goldi]|uniref:C-type lectin domain-containing protein n=1 Tax=Cylicostephanus goldi TaxID=71465 RepID=A0A3P7PS58_CYLGO|nr:unnamed protein product [Cylicostephanus goldi]